MHLHMRSPEVCRAALEIPFPLTDRLATTIQPADDRRRKMPKRSEIVIWFAAIISGNVAASLVMGHSRAAGATSYVNLGFGVPTGLIAGGLTWFILSRLWAIYSSCRM
jgi:hypothetical protein